jgi:hypothetical protein
MSVSSPFIWDGDWYNSAAAAFHASKLESRTARTPLIKCNCKSWQANQIESQIREWDMRPNWHAGSPSRSRGYRFLISKLARESCCFPARHCETLLTSK